MHAYTDTHAQRHLLIEQRTKIHGHLLQNRNPKSYCTQPKITAQLQHQATATRGGASEGRRGGGPATASTEAEIGGFLRCWLA